MDEDLDRLFASLADPTRRAILAALLDGPRSVSELAAPFPTSLAAVSKHLQILTRAGLISQTREGRVTICQLDPDSLQAAAVWIQGLGAFDATDYDALERLLDVALDTLSADGLHGDLEAGLDDALGSGEVD